MSQLTGVMVSELLPPLPSSPKLHPPPPQDAGKGEGDDGQPILAVIFTGKSERGGGRVARAYTHYTYLDLYPLHWKFFI
jgi:hypothetical protein